MNMESIYLKFTDGTSITISNVHNVHFDGRLILITWESFAYKMQYDDYDLSIVSEFYIS